MGHPTASGGTPQTPSTQGKEGGHPITLQHPPQPLGTRRTPIEGLQVTVPRTSLTLPEPPDPPKGPPIPGPPRGAAGRGRSPRSRPRSSSRRGCSYPNNSAATGGGYEKLGDPPSPYSGILPPPCFGGGGAGLPCTHPGTLKALEKHWVPKGGGLNPTTPQCTPHLSGDPKTPLETPPSAPHIPPGTPQLPWGTPVHPTSPSNPPVHPKSPPRTPR